METTIVIQYSYTWMGQFEYLFKKLNTFYKWRTMNHVVRLCNFLCICAMCNDMHCPKKIGKIFSSISLSCLVCSLASKLSLICFAFFVHTRVSISAGTSHFLYRRTLQFYLDLTLGSHHSSNEYMHSHLPRFLFFLWTRLSLVTTCIMLLLLYQRKSVFSSIHLPIFLFPFRFWRRHYFVEI